MKILKTFLYVLVTVLVTYSSCPPNPDPPPDPPVDPEVTGATVFWNPNTESDLAGYRVYLGTVPGVYTETFNASTTEYKLDSLIVGTNYCVAVTAYDYNMNESGYSDEVCFLAKKVDPDTTGPEDPQNDICEMCGGEIYQELKTGGSCTRCPKGLMNSSYNDQCLAMYLKESNLQDPTITEMWVEIIVGFTISGFEVKEHNTKYAICELIRDNTLRITVREVSGIYHTVHIENVKVW